MDRKLARKFASLRSARRRQRETPPPPPTPPEATRPPEPPDDREFAWMIEVGGPQPCPLGS